MNSKAKIFLPSALVCFIFLSNINAENDFKSQVGDNLGAVLKGEVIKLTETNIKAAEEFYNAVINTIPFPAEFVEMFHEQLQELRKIRINIAGNDSTKLIESLKNLLKNIFHDIMRSTNLLPKAEDDKRKKMQKLIDDCKRKLDESVAIFINNLIKEWSTVYSTIPAEEKAKDDQYEKLNSLIETAAETENDPQTQLHEKAIAVMKAMREVSDFFGYSVWSDLLKDFD